MRRIAAVTVNHNTSLYTELLLRSLFATHPPAAELGLELTVLDNASEDDTATLRAYAATVGVPVRQSGFATHTERNSHGEVLRRFVLDHPQATHYLFLDTDTVFAQPNAIGIMADELDAAPEEVFGAGPRMGYPWMPGEEIPAAMFAAVYERRLHPFCALFRNTPLFRRVAAEIGFHPYRALLTEGDRYLDTGEMLSVAMRAFGYRALRADVLVGHCFAVSYDAYGEGYLAHRAQRRDALLQGLRARGGAAGTAPDPASA
jgi:hypothetical protein